MGFMKKIGLIGGMSWESSQVYYRILNESIRERLGGNHSCKCIMDSVDFAEIEKLQHEGDHDAMRKAMIDSAKNLEKAGADLMILCTNTMHMFSDAMIENITIPFLHIAQATGRKIQTDNFKRVLLLGTKFTMEGDFYKAGLKKEFGIDTMIPNKTDRDLVHQIIYSELVRGIISESSKKQYIEIINKAAELGAEGVILGCTEIPLLIQQDDVDIPVFDTTRIHAEYAVDFALSDD